MLLQVTILLCFVLGTSQAMSQNKLATRIASLQSAIDGMKAEQFKQQQHILQLNKLQEQVKQQQQTISDFSNLVSSLQEQIRDLRERQSQIVSQRSFTTVDPSQRSSTSAQPFQRSFGTETGTEGPVSTTPPVASGQYPHRVFRVNRATFGVISSGSSASLVCVNRKSTPSGIGDDATTSVGCEAGEVMTSCSSYTQDNSLFRDGEKFSFENGAPVCIAYNGFRSTAPAIAQARCCRRTGLSCELAASGPLSFSDSADGDRAETVCTSGRLATGCSAYSWYVNLDGALHTRNSCIAQMDGFAENSGAVYSGAFCCSSPNLRCSIRTSTEGGRTKGSSVYTECAPNQVMLGCSGFSEDGRLAGSRITDGSRPRCEAISGSDRQPGQRGVVASAVCCSA